MPAFPRVISAKFFNQTDALLPCGDIDLLSGVSLPDLTDPSYDPTVYQWFLIAYTWEGTGFSDTAGNTYTAIPGASDGPVTAYLAPYTSQFLTTSNVFSGGSTCKGLQVIVFGADPTTPLAGIKVNTGSFSGPPSTGPGTLYTETHTGDHVDLPADYYTGNDIIVAILRGADNLDGSDPALIVSAISPNPSIDFFTSPTSTISPTPTHLGILAATFETAASGSGILQNVFLNDLQNLGNPVHSSGYAQARADFSRGGTHQNLDWALICFVTSDIELGAPPDDGTPPAVPITDGVDLITSLVGLHRVYRSETDRTHINFQTLRWGAADWDAPVTIATDADDTTDNGSAPCLAITDDQDVMVCWYHTPTAVAAGFISEDFGQTWDAYAAIIGHRYPRVAFMREKTIVGLFNADILALFESADGGTTLDLAVTFGPQPKQRISLQVDGLNFLHAVWENSDGQVIHRGSRSPGQVGSWSDPELLVSGHVPGYAVGHRRAVNCCFDEADPPNLNFGLTDSTYGVSDSASDIDTPAGVFFERAWVGLVWDVRDHLWLLARAYSTGHAMLLWKTENDRDWLLFGGGGGLGP
jgi:hypothetical protein